MGTSVGLGKLDDRIAASQFNGDRSSWTGLDATFEAGEYLGGSFVQLGAALAAYGVGRLADRPRLTTLGHDLVRVQILNGVVTHALKASVGRERPDGSGRHSFPSGHASSTFATAAVLRRHFGWRIGAPAFGIASYVAASRLNENRHYLSDVVFGAAVGMAAGRTVTFELGRKRFELSPLVVDGGAGVQVNLVGF